jgi:uncharacterized protein YkwD
MMKGCAVGAALVLLLLLPVRAAHARSIAQAEQLLVDAINQTRADFQLPPLARDPVLDRWARTRAATMIRERFFGHPAGLARLPGRVVGENLAWCSSWIRVQSVIKAWLASPAHRANLLRPGFRRVGIAVAVGPLEGVRNSRIVTVDFAGR